MDAEPTLILDNINVFITVVARARVEDLERDLKRVGKALERLCEFLVERRRYEKGEGEEYVGVDACYRNEIKERLNDELLKKYASECGIQNPSDDDLRYIRQYIFGYDITGALSDNDKDTLSIDYLAEAPFIRLDLREITIRLGNDFPVEGLRNRELRCHPTAVVHRLGAAAVTCWVEVPTQLTVEDTNRLIQALMEEQVEIEVQYIEKRENTTLRKYLDNSAKALLAPLIQILMEEEPDPKRMQREDIIEKLLKEDDIVTDNIVLHVGGVSMKKEDSNTAPITRTEDLIECCPRQVASLASGRIDWRSYTLDEAAEYRKGALAAIYQNHLVMIGTRGVVIYLETPSDPDYLKRVNNVLRDPDHERHHHSVLQAFADNVLQIYQLVGIAKTALETYNLRIRKIRTYSPWNAIFGKIARLLYLVEEGLVEIDNYSLARIKPPRTMIHMALERSGVLKLRKIVERRLTYTHRTLAEMYSMITNYMIILLTFVLLVLSFLDVSQRFLTQPHTWYEHLPWLVFIMGFILIIPIIVIIMERLI